MIQSNPHCITNESSNAKKLNPKVPDQTTNDMVKINEIISQRKERGI